MLMLFVFVFVFVFVSVIVVSVYMLAFGRCCDDFVLVCSSTPSRWRNVDVLMIGLHVLHRSGCIGPVADKLQLQHFEVYPANVLNFKYICRGGFCYLHGSLAIILLLHTHISPDPSSLLINISKCHSKEPL